MSARWRIPLLVVLSIVWPLAAAAEEPVLLRTVVVGVQGRRNVDDALALAMSDVVQGEIAKDKRRTVFGRTDLIRVLEFESERQALGCNDDSCLAELASALAADRIITGSMDKIGSTYFVVLTEIDANDVAPLGRVQRRLPLDENKLIDGVLSMTKELQKQTRASTATAVSAADPAGTEAGSGGMAAGPPGDGADPASGDGADPAAGAAIASAIVGADASGDVGTVLITTEPSGLEVLLGDRTMGRTPLRLQDVPRGTAALRVKSDDVVLPVDVPVATSSITEVSARLDVEDRLSADETKRFEEAQSSHSTWAWVTAGGGLGGGCAAGTLSFLIGLVAGVGGAGDPTTGVVVGALCCACPTVVGLGVMGYGLFDLFANAPEAPVPMGKMHVIEVKPEGSEPVIFEVDAKRGSDIGHDEGIDEGEDEYYEEDDDSRGDDEDEYLPSYERDDERAYYQRRRGDTVLY